MADQLAEKCNNFRIISDESVKQWIVVCDKVYTGNSSVVVEAYFAKKMCQLLFPLPTTPGFELKLITDSQKLVTYDEFCESVFTEKETFPTPERSIEEIYLIDWDTPNYVKFADMAEEILRDDYYRLSKKQLRAYKEYSKAESMMRLFISIRPLYGIYLALLKNLKLKWSFLERQRKIRAESEKRVAEIESSHAHELTSEDEICSIINRIKYALEYK